MDDVGRDDRSLLPMACTLSPTDGTRRLAEWQQITAVASLGHVMEPGLVTLRFRDAPSVGAELARLVAAERDCCSSLRWDLVRTATEWRVEVAGHDEALRSLPSMT